MHIKGRSGGHEQPGIGSWHTVGHGIREVIHGVLWEEGLAGRCLRDGVLCHTEPGEPRDTAAMVTPPRPLHLPSYYTPYTSTINLRRLFSLRIEPRRCYQPLQTRIQPPAPRSTPQLCIFHSKFLLCSSSRSLLEHTRAVTESPPLRIYFFYFALYSRRLLFCRLTSPGYVKMSASKAFSYFLFLVLGIYSFEHQAETR